GLEPRQPRPCGWASLSRIGSGSNAVLLHGLLRCAAQWRPAAAALAAPFSCWLFELPGISGSRADDMSLPGLARWLKQAVAVLGIERPGLVGSSWGGAVALQYATGEPVSGLIL